jgi:hypothetical protein
MAEKNVLVLDFSKATLVTDQCGPDVVDGIYYNGSYTGSKAREEAGKDPLKVHERLGFSVKCGKTSHRIVVREYKDTGSIFVDIYEAGSEGGFVGELNTKDSTGVAEVLAPIAIQAKLIGKAAAAERKAGPMQAFVKAFQTKTPVAKAQQS